MFGKRLRLLFIFVTVCLSLSGLSSISVAQETESECSSERDISSINLPENLRVVVRQGQENHLSIYDPHGFYQPITDTSGQGLMGIPMMFNNGENILVLTPIDNEMLWTTLDVAGTWRKQIHRSSYVQVIHWMGDQLLFSTDYEGGIHLIEYQIMDLQTETVTQVEYPDFVDFLGHHNEPSVPYNYKFNATAELIAYWAIRSDETGNELSKQPTTIIRIQDLKTGEIIDLDPIRNFSTIRRFTRDTPFGWTNNPPILVVYPIDRKERVVELYSATDGERLYTFPSEVSEGLSGYIRWSPDQKQLALNWGTETGELSKVVVYDMGDQPQEVACFEQEHDGGPLFFDDYHFPNLFWTPDGRFIWWLECAEPCEILRAPIDDTTYNLMIAEVATGKYGTLLENVGWYSSVGFANGGNN